MDKLVTFYNPRQNVDENDSFSPSAGKPRLVVEAYAESLKILSDWWPVAREDIYLAHDRRHVDEVLSCKKLNGFSNTSKEIADSLYWTIGSFYNAARHAYSSKTVAFSPTSGFHHATYDKSMGFCTFNGLMVAAMLLKRNEKVDNVGIIDFDMHWGNGTIEVSKRCGGEYVKHMAFSDQIGNDYGRWLDDLPGTLEERFSDADILFYQAGADPHIDDPLGMQLTTEQMESRDRIVLAFARKNAIPIVWNLAGGYQSPVAKVVALHGRTIGLCLEIF